MDMFVKPLSEMGNEIYNDIPSKVYMKEFENTKFNINYLLLWYKSSEIYISKYTKQKEKYSE